MVFIEQPLVLPASAKQYMSYIFFVSLKRRKICAAFLSSPYRMAGIDEDDELLPSCVEDVRASIDVDQDGDISKEEFVKNALNNKFIARMLKYSKPSNHE